MRKALHAHLVANHCDQLDSSGTDPGDEHVLDNVDGDWPLRRGVSRGDSCQLPYAILGDDPVHQGKGRRGQSRGQGYKGSFLIILAAALAFKVFATAEEHGRERGRTRGAVLLGVAQGPSGLASHIPGLEDERTELLLRRPRRRQAEGRRGGGTVPSALGAGEEG